MTTIAARARLGVPFLPLDDEERSAALTRRRHLPRSLVAWLLVPALAALVAVGLMYAAQTARATALTYQAAALRAGNARLQQMAARQAQQLQQLQSAGRIAQAASHLGLAPPSSWSVASPAPSHAADPLTPVIVALRGG
ncbi:MAG: hypothetical protein ACREN7_04160 [Candidatus Dormibacteria bacterium]